METSIRREGKDIEVEVPKPETLWELKSASQRGELSRSFLSSPVSVTIKDTREQIEVAVKDILFRQ